MAQGKTDIDLSIVIPAYREEKRIGATLDKLSSFLKEDAFIRGKNIEVIVVSADSPDNTHTVIKNKASLFTNFLFLTPGSRVGKGRDVKAGILKSSGKAVLFMDADLATPLKHITDFYKIHGQGYDIVVATRDLKRYRRSPPRMFVSFFGNLLFKLAGGIWIKDSQCGFKLFSRDSARLCFGKLRILGWGFDMEILTIASVNAMSLRKVNINDWESVPNGVYEDNVLLNSARSLFDLSRIFYRRVTNAYQA